MYVIDLCSFSSTDIIKDAQRKGSDAPSGRYATQETSRSRHCHDSYKVKSY